jgi:DNA-binding transcriptional LysR family regulator
MGSNERFLNRASGIEEFVRVAETLSFARAAESLGQAPSAVSKSIRHLEGRLGVRLFHRTTRSVSLTDEGVTFYERARRWTLELDEMQSAISGDAAELSGLVRLDIPTTFFRSMLIPYLAAFLDRYPTVSVEVRMNDHHVNLVADAVDLALRIGPLTDSELIAKPMGHIIMGTYANPSCLKQHGTPLRPADLASHRLIALLLSSGRAKPMLYTDARTDIVIDSGHAVASFTNGDAMIDAALAGIGIAQTPALYARQGLTEGRLVQVLPGLDAPGPPIQLVYPSRRQLPRRVRAVMDCIIDAIEEGLGDAYRKP